MAQPAAAVAALVLAGACSSNVASRDDGSSSTPGGSDRLPVVQQDADEEGPTDVASALEASDLVVLATVAGVTPGGRFYGGDDAEDLASSTWFEDVDLHLSVSHYLKGSGPQRLDIRWPTYLTEEPSSDTRIAALEIGGVRRDLSREGTYVFFLKDHGEPWGLTSVSQGASLIEVGPDLSIEGQLSFVFRDLRGKNLTDALPDGVSVPTGNRP